MAAAVPFQETVKSALGRAITYDNFCIPYESARTSAP